jgi:multidrug efflux pump subunit AcrA (membrane-fusion protein)
MAMPGRPLLTLYDPAALRVTVAIPQSAALGLAADAAIKLQLPGLPAGREWVTPTRVAVLPTVDAATHTVQLRLDLPSPTPGVTPGQFARAWLPATAQGSARLTVPASALVHRAEMTGVYVVGADGRALLRQVRPGPVQGDSVEILSGVSAGERVALDPQAATRVH